MRLLVLLALFQFIHVQVYCASMLSENEGIKTVSMDEKIDYISPTNIDLSTVVSFDSDDEHRDRGISNARSITSLSSSSFNVISEGNYKENGSEIVEGDTSLFPHKIGIRNHANNCYASALISCLYNIPIVQKALFDEVSSLNLRKENSITSALATIFYKMRFGKSLIDLEPFFIPAVKKSFEWNFGGIECVLEFWNQISCHLPESLFQIELQENRLRKIDNVLIKSVPQKSNLILVSPSKKYRNIEEFLENDFIDEEAEDFVIELNEINEYPHLFIEEAKEKVKIPSKTSLTILNCPEVLIFGVKRVVWNFETNSSEFNSTQLGFPEKLTINSEEYTIVGNIEYDERRIHYYSQNHDLLDDQWYIHDDKFVAKIPDTEEDFNDLTKKFIHNSSMVFYVKSASLEEFGSKESVEISKELIKKLKSRSKSSITGAACALKRKRKCNEDNATIAASVTVTKEAIVTSSTSSNLTSSIVTSSNLTTAADNIAKVVKKVRGTYSKKPKEKLSVENETNKQIKNELDGEGSSSQSTDFRLGSKQFSFTTEYRNTVLESILMAFTSHPKIISKLFESVKTNSSADFEFKFAVIVLRILTGHMNINTKELATILNDNYGVDFNDIETVWRLISQLISPEISSVPDLKIITFKQDEPLSIEAIPKYQFYSLKPRETLNIPREIKLSGPAYDSIVDLNEGIFKRTILKCTGDDESRIILPIPIERIFKDPTAGTFIYDSNPVEISTGPYLIHGFIGIDKEDSGAFAIYTDHLRQGRFLLYSSGIPRYRESSALLQDFISKLMKNQSTLFLLTKDDGFYEEMPMLSDVPKILFDEI